MRVNMTIRGGCVSWTLPARSPHRSGPAVPDFSLLRLASLPHSWPLLPPYARPLSPCAVFWKLPMLSAGSVLRLSLLAFRLSRTIVLCCLSVLKNVFSVWFGVSGRRINVVPGIPS